jgi:hypothetical protein
MNTALFHYLKNNNVVSTLKVKGYFYLGNYLSQSSFEPLFLDQGLHAVGHLLKDN